MRHVVGTWVVFLITTSLMAQEPLLTWTAADSRKMLHKFLMAEAHKHFESRRKTVSQLRTPEEVAQRQQELRKKFRAALGDFPDKTPLNTRILGTLRGEGFRVEKVIYESRPHHHVTANFYLPEGKGPFPGILLPCGHSINGKAAEPYQRACILLARNGMAALCYDPIGQGERLQLLDDHNKPGIAGITNEHNLIGIGALLVGQSTASFRIWDGIRGLDFLASRPEIDAQKLGCTGNSGGGTMTAYLMALEDRIACAAPSCYITSLERLFATIGPQDAEQNIPGQVAFGMEHADYLTMRAPLPILIAIASQDYFDAQGAWSSFREASLIYGKLGHGERIVLFEYDDKHGFSKPRREAVLRWMRRWLQRIDDAPVEDSSSIFTDEALQCTRSGQVLADYQGISAFTLNALAAKKWAGQRAKFLTLTEHARKAEICRLLGLPPEIPAARDMSQQIFSPTDRTSAHRILYETESGIQLPGWRYKHRTPKGATILYLPESGIPDDGKLPVWLGERHQKDHQEVWVLDLRGLGATSPRLVPARPTYVGSDAQDAFLSMHLNRPLLGQRVLDVLSVIKTIHHQNIHLVGTGTTGPIALHAAALDSSIREITVENALDSWMSVVQQPISYHQLSNVIPGVLKSYDLPDLAATLAPRLLTIRNCVDGRQEPISKSNLEKSYEACRRCYTSQNAANMLHLQAAP